MDSQWLDVATLAERPDRLPLITGFDDPDVPEFLYQDPVSVALFADLVARHPAYTILAVERATGSPAAMVCTMPFTLPADGTPPPGGYDAVLLSAAADTLAGRTGESVSALFATVRPDLRGRGVSALMLAAALRNTAALGHSALLAPVRPTHKHQHPQLSMLEYLDRRRPDGTAEDPWVRVHERAGGTFTGVAPHSMSISAQLSAWRAWTGLPFDHTGPVTVPGGLVPVQCDLAGGIATYIEPNAWFRHTLR